ncbi:MAG: hypothetical protein IJ756_00960 [Paludibacteraceae bacterium]|nr:hypothetical protein [Paludibacteraceae bacterium]
MKKYMGFTDEMLMHYEAMPSEEDRAAFRKSHRHTLNYEVIIETIVGFLIKALHTQKGKPTDEIKRHAQLELQMLTTKLLASHVLFQKWGGYNIEKDIKLNPIVDPIVLGGLARSIYETLGVFQLVYLLPENEEKQLIAFKLWQRHSFLDNIKDIEDTIMLNKNIRHDTSKLQEQLQFDKEQCAQLLSDVVNTAYAVSHKDCDFDSGNVKKSLVILDDDPRFISLSGIDGKMDYCIPLKNVVFKNLYSILSHYAHPSYQAEEQFGNEFKGADNNSEGSYNMIVSVTAILVVCFISSYIVYDNSLQEVLNDDEK